MTTSALFLALGALVCGLLLGWLIGSARTSNRFTARLAAAETARDLQFGRVEALEADAQIATELATLVAPLGQTVSRLESQVREQERERIAQLARLDTQMTQLSRSEAQLHDSTHRLLQALNSSGSRGSWGEVHLRRVVEHAGLRDRVDFTAQLGAVNGRGARVRPDMVVRLPEGGLIVIDAKAPLVDDESLDEDARDARQAKLLATHVTALAAKEYWSAFPTAPQFTVLFLPSEGLLAGALRAQPDLLDTALRTGVVLATPATLVALLKTVALGWRQHDVGESAHVLLNLGQELHARIATLGGHLEKLGGSLNRAVEDYNRLLGSLETRVLVSARRMGELGGFAEAVPEPAPLDAAARRTSADELRPGA